MHRVSTETKLCSNCYRASAVCSIVCAVLSLGVAVLAPIVLDRITQNGVHDAVVLSPSNGYVHFINSSSDTTNRFVVSFFNISNARELLDFEHIKPNLTEIGPFVYNYNKIRHDVMFSGDGTEVTFHQQVYLEFNSEETSLASNGKWDDDSTVEITTLNLVFNGMKYQAGNSYWHLISDLLLFKDDYDRLFDKRTPQELIQGFTVYVDLPGGIKVPIAYPGIQPNIPKSKDPDMLHTTTMKTGKDDIKEAYAYVNWRNSTSTKIMCPFGGYHLPLDEQCKVTPYPCCGQKFPVPVWDTKLAPGEFDEDSNRINGGTGDSVGPGLHGEFEQVMIFSDLNERVMAWNTRRGEAKFDFHGVYLRKFRPDDRLVWGNYTERPENARYYQWGPHGLMNMTVLYGADIYISLPHFLNSDRRLQDAVDGLSPNPEKHEMYIGVEPYTGIAIVEHERVMVNVRVGEVPASQIPGLDHGWFPSLKGRELYIPLAWFDVSAEPFLSTIDPLKQMYFAQKMQAVLLYAGIAICSLSVIWMMGLFAFWCKRSKAARAAQAALLEEEARADASR